MWPMSRNRPATTTIQGTGPMAPEPSVLITGGTL